MKGFAVDPKKLSADGDRVSARRRLVRGAFAAPAVLTLFSGGAVAGTSSQCLSAALKSPVTNPASSTGYCRVPRYNLVVGLNAAQQPNAWKYYAWGTDVIKLKKPGASCFMTSNSQWACTDNTAPINPCTWTSSGGTVYTPQKDTADNWIAVRVDKEGNIVGLCGPGSLAGTAVSGTCWASLVA